MEWNEIYNELTKLPNHLSGNRFERFALSFLEGQTEIKRGWLLKDTPQNIKSSLNISTDFGVDAILEDNNNNYILAQFKFVNNESKTITWSGTKLANFVAENTLNKRMYVVTNAKGVDKHTASRLPIQSRVFTKVDLEKFNFETKKISKEVIIPKPHQEIAIKKALDYYLKSNIGRLVLPCGVGKTYTAAWIAKGMSTKRMVVCAPSIALVKQLKENFLKIIDMPYLIVCSENTTNEEVGHITTTPEEIKKFTSSNNKYIIFSTYQSLDVLLLGIKGADIQFKIADEAHRTTSPEYSDFHNIKSKKTLFMTATERHVSDEMLDDEDVHGMNQERKYGEIIHSMTFGEAVEKGLLCDYDIIIAAVTDADLAKEVRDRKYVKGYTSIDEVGNNIVLQKLYKEGVVNKTLVYFNSIKGSDEFVKRHEDDIYIDSVKGKDGATKRNAVINALRNQPKAIISNCKVFTEGIDVPSIDAVMYADPKNSMIDIVQSTGRCLRIDVSNSNKRGKIILPVFCKNVDDIDVEIEESSFKQVKRVIERMRQYDGRLTEVIKVKRDGDGPRSEYKRQPTISIIGFENEAINDVTLINKLKENLTFKVISGINSNRKIVNITEENLLWMLKHGKVDERIYG